MLISQIALRSGKIGIVARNNEGAFLVNNTDSIYELATAAITAGIGIEQCIVQRGLGASVELASEYQAGNIRLPIQHPDPLHMHLTGTGLTHLGSASTRNAMHAKDTQSTEEHQTDSIKMFQMGVEGGKPDKGNIGVQPEWFYKGNGTVAVDPGKALASPNFALDGGEEPEIAGIYIIAGDGTPFRIGFALANEFSDHVTEKINYLYLAHSKLRPCSFGPEILIGNLPTNVEGMSRIRRDGNVIWEKPFLSGEQNMSHTIANLEHHHFKYDGFCQPGDVHIHMFGTATLSFADDIKANEGDVFEIESPIFGLPLHNSLKETTTAKNAVQVRVL